MCYPLLGHYTTNAMALGAWVKGGRRVIMAEGGVKEVTDLTGRGGGGRKCRLKKV